MIKMKPPIWAAQIEYTYRLNLIYALRDSNINVVLNHYKLNNQTYDGSMLHKFIARGLIAEWHLKICSFSPGYDHWLLNCHTSLG